MELKVILMHLTKLSENILCADTAAYVQKQKKTLDTNHRYCNNYKIVHAIHQRSNKTTKKIRPSFKKTIFE